MNDVRNTARALACIAFICVATPAAAGELWIDYLEERFPICPSGSDPAATLDERAGDFLRTMAYELDKIEHSEDAGASSLFEGLDEADVTFDAERQRAIVEWLEGSRYFLMLMLPPLERVERVELDASETVRVGTTDPYLPPGEHAPLRAAFATMLIEQPLSDDRHAPLSGPILYDYLDARARAYVELPDEGMVPSTPIVSLDLRVALSQIHHAYEGLRPALFALVDRPDFGARLEEHLWAQCRNAQSPAKEGA